jgi:hypothetical protein
MHSKCPIHLTAIIFAQQCRLSSCFLIVLSLLPCPFHVSSSARCSPFPFKPVGIQ